jgi:integrase
LAYRGVVRAVAVDEVARMLQGCDRRSGTGRRDVAILAVLARLGSRRGEVAALSVDDINWRTGELVVTGKGHRCDFCRYRSTRVRRSPSTVVRSPQRALPHLVREFPGAVGRFVAQRHRPSRGSRA